MSWAEHGFLSVSSTPCPYGSLSGSNNAARYWSPDVGVLDPTENTMRLFFFSSVITFLLLLPQPRTAFFFFLL